MILFPLNEKMPRSPNVPKGLLLNVEPIASAASSIIGILYFFEMLIISFNLAGKP